jgi:uncharacterized PurR-regulated membrane protein YhhQ (DUF165 family)
VKSRWLLRAFCIWTVFVFVVLIKNMILSSDDGVGFRVVHTTIGLISIAFAFACWPLAKRIRGSED